MDIVFRPVWTCGRYNENGNVAIIYNLLEGMSYLFKDDSAFVVSLLLSIKRNSSISIHSISEKTGIATESLIPFFHELMEVGLLVDHCPTAEEVHKFRVQLSERNRTQSQQTVKTTQEKLPMAISSVEMDYTDKAGGITSVMFELTYRCSEQCIHCYNIGATRNDSEISHRGELNELTFDDYKRIIDELYEQGLTKVCLSGGDPFSKSHVWEIIDYLYNKEVAFDIYTNALGLKYDAERLANYFPRLVGISIYSGNSQVHDSITRVKNSWHNSMSVVKTLSELAVPVVLKCCIMKPNVNSYHEVIDLAKQYGIQTQFELNVTDSIDGDKCVSKYLRLPKELLEIVLRDDNTPMYVGKEAPNYGGQPRKMDQNACGAGCNSFCITPDGDFIPCCAFHLSFGNLKRQTLSEILTNNVELNHWQNLILENYEECGRYDYCAYCNLCPGNNYSEHGNVLKAGENNCFMAKSRFELAHKLMKGLDPLHGKTVKDSINDLNTNNIPLKTIKREYNNK